MSSYEDLQQGIRNLCITSLVEYFPTQEDQDELIFFTHDNGPEPSRPYVSINILGVSQQGHKSTSSHLREDQLTLSTQVNYEVTVQFGFSGSTSGLLAQEFTQRINNTPTVIDGYKTHKVGVMRKTNIRRIPQKRETLWIDYFNLDVVFSYALVTKESIDYIESAVIENVTYEDTFRVPESPIPNI